METTRIKVRPDLKEDVNVMITTEDEAQIPVDKHKAYDSISAQTEYGDITLIWIAEEWRQIVNIDFE